MTRCRIRPDPDAGTAGIFGLEFWRNALDGLQPTPLDLANFVLRFSFGHGLGIVILSSIRRPARASRRALFETPATLRPNTLDGGEVALRLFHSLPRTLSSSLSTLRFDVIVMWIGLIRFRFSRMQPTAERRRGDEQGEAVSMISYLVVQRLSLN